MPLEAEGIKQVTTDGRITQDDAMKLFEGMLDLEEKGEAAPQAPQGDTSAGEPDETEAEAAPSAAEAAPEEEVVEEEIQDRPRYRVKVQGEEIEVDQDELLRGYSRTQDYTRKTQEAAEIRKRAEAREAKAAAEEAAAREERARLAQNLELLDKAVKESEPAEPDWDQRRKVLGPAEYAQEHTDWMVYKGKRDALTKAKETAALKVAEDQRKQFSEYLVAEDAKLLDALPAWKDAKVRKKEQDAMIEFARGRGFSDADLSISDHRLVLLLRDAWKSNGGKVATPTIRPGTTATATARPGSAPPSRPPTTEMTKAKQRLAKTGRVKDAANIFERMLD